MLLHLLPFQAGPVGKLAVTLQHSRTTLVALLEHIVRTNLNNG